MDELQPAEMVWGLINTHALARCMHVIAEFGVADALENRASSGRGRVAPAQGVPNGTRTCGELQRTAQF